MVQEEAETTTAPETTKQEKTEMETENSKEKDEYYVEMVGSFATVSAI